jgi:Flp pilus assembly protein TadB
VKWITRCPIAGSFPVAQALPPPVARSNGDPDLSEADMLQNTISGRRGNPLGEAVWIVAGISVVMAFGDVFVVLALALAIAAMTAAWWVHRQVGQHEERNDARLASVTQLCAGSALETSAHTVHGPRAA